MREVSMQAAIDWYEINFSTPSSMFPVVISGILNDLLPIKSCNIQIKDKNFGRCDIEFHSPTLRFLENSVIATCPNEIQYPKNIVGNYFSFYQFDSNLLPGGKCMDVLAKGDAWRNEYEIRKMFVDDQLHAVEKNVFRRIKYFFNRKNLGWNRCTTIYKDIDGKWEQFPLEINCWASIDVFHDPDPQRLQAMVSGDFLPFAAFDYVDLALKSPDPNQMWILATTAAELGIKEFFCQLKPDLSTFLRGMPSPPLFILYGKILKEFTGLEVNVRLIQKGVEIRNKLVHDPSTKAVKRWESDSYAGEIKKILLVLNNYLSPVFEIARLNGVHNP